MTAQASSKDAAVSLHHDVERLEVTRRPRGAPSMSLPSNGAVRSPDARVSVTVFPSVPGLRDERPSGQKYCRAVRCPIPSAVGDRRRVGEGPELIQRHRGLGYVRIRQPRRGRSLVGVAPDSTCRRAFQRRSLTGFYGNVRSGVGNRQGAGERPRLIQCQCRCSLIQFICHGNYG